MGLKFKRGTGFQPHKSGQLANQPRWVWPFDADFGLGSALNSCTVASATNQVILKGAATGAATKVGSSLVECMPLVQALLESQEPFWKVCQAYADL